MEPNSSSLTDPCATNRCFWPWEPGSFGDYARHMAVGLAVAMAVGLAVVMAAMWLILALKAAVQYLLVLGRSRRARHGRAGSGSGDRHRARDSNAISDPERPAVEAPPPPPSDLVYSAASTKLAGATAEECIICLAEFADGDAIRVMPACRHGFHALCIERWLTGDRRSSCPTCRAPAAVATGAAAAAQP